MTRTVVAFGTYDTARHPRVGVLAAGLRAHGFAVRELNRPLGFSTAERVRMLQQPWRLPRLAGRLLRCWLLLAVDTVRLRRAEGAPAAVLVGYLGHFDVVLARLLFPRATVVLDHLVFAGDTATDRGAHGVRVRLLQGLDRLATACADVVVADTAEHRDMLRDPGRGVVVPVGATDEWFAAGDAASVSDREGRSSGLRAVFFGLFTPLQGTGVLAAALADALPKAAAAGRPIEVTMVGSGQDLAQARERLAGLDGVRWVEWVEPADLPGLVAGHDVCLGIFSATAKGRRVVPNKVFQGLAAACVVVTSDTPPQRRLLADHAVLVPPADPGALSEALVALTEPAARSAANARGHAGRERFRPVAVVPPLVAALAERGVTP